jgi:hypothetical protein
MVMETEGNLPDPAGEGTASLRVARPYCRLETPCCAVPDISKYGYCGRGQLKCDGTHAETRFRLSAKRTSPF